MMGKEEDLAYWKARCKHAEESLKMLLTFINPMDPSLEGAMYTVLDLRNPGAREEKE